MKFKINTWSVGLIALTAFGYVANLYELENGVRGEYYAAVVKSMSLNPYNFFLGAFDPAGAISLDKIPGSFWLPALFVRIFGFSTWSIEAPNALATIAASIIMAFAVRRLAGAKAGLLAGLIVASTPVLVAVSRTNHPESIFVLVLAIVAFAATKAFQTKKLRHLIFLGLWVAVGFDCYMLEAWAVWPAIAIAWIVSARSSTHSQRYSKKLLEVVIAGVTSLMASLIWPTVVWLIPSASRPYIGGTLHNNPFEMIFGYNGLGRFGITAGLSQGQYKTYTPEFAGHAGLTRMFNHYLAGQIAWMLPTAALAIVVLLSLKKFSPTLLFFAVWFVSLFAMFSTVAGMHQFYTSALVVPASVLVAVALAEARRAKAKWRFMALIAATALTAVFVRRYYAHYHPTLELLQFGLAAVACLLILFESKLSSWLVRFVMPSFVVLGLLLSPMFWSLDAQNYVTPMNPVAGNMAPPKVIRALEKPKPNGQQLASDAPKQALIDYLTAHQDGRRFAFATLGGLTAAPLITRTNLSILPIGGFNGSDAYPSLDQFKQMIADGQLRYVIQIHSEMVLAAKIDGLKELPVNLGQIESWVMSHCQKQHYLPPSWHVYHGARIYQCEVSR